MFVKEKEMFKVKVPDEFTADGVEAVIRYCYFGSVDDAVATDMELAEEIFNVASYYGVSDLMEAVEAGFSAELREKYPSDPPMVGWIAPLSVYCVL